MKILIVSARYYPEQFSITNIAEGLVALGHDVTVLTGKPNYGYSKTVKDYECKEKEIINRVKVQRVNEKARQPGLMGLIKNYLSTYFEFKKTLRKFDGDFDIIISHGISPIFTMAGIKKFKKRKRIPHIHYGLDLWPESLIATRYIKHRGLIFHIMKSYCRRLYKTCDHIAFSSPSAEKYFKEYLKLDIPFSHIYQPCLSTPPEHEDISSHMYRKDGKIHLLYCGTVARFHKMPLLVEALSKCPSKNSFAIDIVGDGSQLPALKKSVEDFGVSKMFTFHGRVSVNETKKYLLNADVLYVPLTNNCKTSLLIPQKVPEYLMYGKPIFGFIVGDGKDLLEKASKGNIICEESAESLAEGLDKIAKMCDADLVRIGNENRSFFDNEKRLKTETICQELEALAKKYAEKS